MQQIPRRGTSGLFTSPNPIGAPAGALTLAKNCMVRRGGILSRRPGVERVGPQLIAGPEALAEFQGEVLVMDGARLARLVEGSWSYYPGVFLPPTGSRMRFLESAQNLYWNDHLGVQRLDSLGGAPERAGMPQALECRVTLAGIGGEQISPNTKVGYRIVIRRDDANLNRHLGAPSFRELVVNPVHDVTLAHAAGTVTVTHTAHGYASGDLVELIDVSDAGFGETSHEVTVVDANTYTYTDGISSPPDSGSARAGKAFHAELQILIPTKAGIRSGDVVQIYRTQLSADQDTDPTDRHKLVEEVVYTSGTVVSYTDTVSDDLLGANLYTNDNEEGGRQGNGRPPACRCMAVWGDHTFYGDYQYEQFKEIDLKRVSTVALGDTLTITAGGGGERTFTAGNVEDVATGTFRLWTTADAETPFSQLAIEKTAKSLLWVLNQDPVIRVYGYYISRVDEGAGKILLKHIEISDEEFNVRGTGGLATSFFPSLAGAGVWSAAKRRKNGLMRSKFQEPEAVAEENENQAGPQNWAVLDLIPLPTMLLIITEVGLYKLTGQTDRKAGNSFAVELHDSTIWPRAKNSFQSLDNSAYGYTNQSMARVTESGSSIVAERIREDLEAYEISRAFQELAVSIPWESQNMLLFSTPRTPTSSERGTLWVYNYIEKQWTTWDLPVSCGLFCKAQGKLYLGNSEDRYLVRIRQAPDDMSGMIFVDEVFPVTVSTTGTTNVVQVSFTEKRAIQPGWLFSQENADGSRNRSHVRSVSGSGPFTLTLDQALPVTAGAATLAAGIDMEVEWVREYGGYPATEKHWPEVQIELESNTTHRHEVGFQADHQPSREVLLPIVYPEEAGWGEDEFGQSPFGGGEAGRMSYSVLVPVPLDHCRGKGLAVYYRNREAEQAINILQITYNVRVYGSKTNALPAKE